uniref:Uncharacterized protein n=1 Tax=Anguilla anguilla TaxID=7936 RepID=A0A0E9XKZ1_ANGAN
MESPLKLNIQYITKNHKNHEKENTWWLGNQQLFRFYKAFPSSQSFFFIKADRSKIRSLASAVCHGRSPLLPSGPYSCSSNPWHVLLCSCSRRGRSLSGCS